MSTAATGRRLTIVRQMAGRGAALTMSLYVLVKLLWVLVACFTGEVPGSWDQTDWLMLNVVTIGMASIGVALGLALAQDWGQRLPAVLVVGLGWIAVGFLVTLLPNLLVSGTLHALGLIPTEVQDSSEGVLPTWEAALLGTAFAGTGLGLAVALPIYVRERWPGAVRRPPPPSSAIRSFAALTAAAGSLVLGIIWLGWAWGMDRGLRTAAPLDADTRLLLASWGAWAVAASGALMVLRSAGTMHVGAARVVAFVGSGSLFAWSAWKLPVALWGPPGAETIEAPLIAVGQHVIGIAAGLLTLCVLVSRTGER